MPYSSLVNSPDFTKAVLEAALDSIVTIDEYNKILDWNNASERIFGWTKEEAVNKSLEIIIPEHLKEAHAIGMKRYLDTRVPKILQQRVEVLAIRKDGVTIDVELAVSPIHYNGRTFFTARLRDISDRKKIEAQKSLFLRELNHRVKNTLAIVQAIATQSLKSGSNPEESNQIFIDRINALSHAHNILTEENWEGAEIRTIIKRITSIYQSSKRSRFRLRGPDIKLGAQDAVSLTLMFHELATNAVKYGSLSVKDGFVFIKWKLCAENRLEIMWKELHGPLVVKPTRQGFGTKLIKRTFKTVVKYSPDGLCCQICINLQDASL